MPLMIAPSGWVVYEIKDTTEEELSQWRAVAFASGTPLISILEALVLTGTAKRVAAIHTFNSLAAHGDGDEADTPFYKEDEEEEDGD